MKLLGAALAVLLLTVATAEAGDKLPKPIDHPIVRPKVREDHKAGKRAGRHPSQYVHPTWGANWDQILNTRQHHEIPRYLFQTQ
jgi:hypothetical protein